MIQKNQEKRNETDSTYNHLSLKIPSLFHPECTPLLDTLSPHDLSSLTMGRGITGMKDHI